MASKCCGSKNEPCVGAEIPFVNRPRRLPNSPDRPAQVRTERGETVNYVYDYERTGRRTTSTQLQSVTPGGDARRRAARASNSLPTHSLECARRFYATGTWNYL